MSGTRELTLAVGDYLCQSSYGFVALVVTGVFLFSPRMLAGLGGWVAVRSVHALLFSLKLFTRLVSQCILTITWVLGSRILSGRSSSALYVRPSRARLLSLAPRPCSAL